MCLFIRNCLFLSPVLIFEIFSEKIGFCGREDHSFGLHQFLVKNQDSVDLKTFFWSSPIGSGKTGLCGRKDIFLVFTDF